MGKIVDREGSTERVHNVLKDKSASMIMFISNTLIVNSIRHGLTLTIPVMVIGAFAIFINHLPVESYQKLMISIFGNDWSSFGVHIHRGTFSIMALGMLLTISYSIAKNSATAREHSINPMIVSIVSLASFFTIIHVDNGLIMINRLGALGVFVAIAVACTSSLLFIYIYSINILKIKIYSTAANQNLTHALSSLIPAFVIIAFFSLVHIFINSIGITDIHDSIYLLLNDLFSGKSPSLLTAVIFITLIHIFWFFGIHGNNVLEPITQNLFVPALQINQDLIAQGLQPTEIFTKQFFDIFVFIGGCGATLCLIIALLISRTRNNTKQIALISILPGIINVNEIIIFGVPVILNFYLLIPFVLLPILLTIITFGAITLGLVPHTIAMVEWTTPLIIGGYKATGSIAGPLLQIFNLIIGVLFYLPFILLQEKHLARGNQSVLQNLLQEVNHLQDIKKTILINRNDDVGDLSRVLAGDLNRSLNNGDIHLVYQPQINSSNRMIGMEALLRWDHPAFGPIAPPITIALAEETPAIHTLGLWIIKTACNQLSHWDSRGMKEPTLSINLSPLQLDNESLPEQILAILKDSGIPPSRLEIEITEQTALGGLKRLNKLHELKKTGIRLAMDDFGMGHSSLMYLKELNLDTIKLDGALIREVLTNNRCQEIVSSIVRLGSSFNFDIIAEYVDTPQQRIQLMALGCMNYQGYLFSPPLDPEELEKYYRELNNTIYL